MHTLSYHPDGSLLASAGTDCSIKLWDTRTAQIAQHFYAHDGSITRVAFHPSGRWLLSASLDGTLRLWDAVAGHVLYTLHGQGGAVHAAAFSPEGNVMATGGEDKHVRIWRSGVGQTNQCLHGTDSQPSSASLAGSFNLDDQTKSASAALPIDQLKTSAAPQQWPRQQGNGEEGADMNLILESGVAPCALHSHASSTQLAAGQQIQTAAENQQMSADDQDTSMSGNIIHVMQRLQDLDKQMELLTHKVHLSENLIRRVAGSAS